MRQSIPRLRSVRFKGGGMIRVLPPDDFRERQYFLHDAKVCAQTQRDIAGYAIVIWGRDMSTTAVSFSGPRSNVPAMMVPDFARNELLSERIERRVLDEVGRRMGLHPPDDEGA